MIRDLKIGNSKTSNLIFFEMSCAECLAIAFPSLIIKSVRLKGKVFAVSSPRLFPRSVRGFVPQIQGPRGEPVLPDASNRSWKI
jgi:hypothetical protein